MGWKFWRVNETPQVLEESVVDIRNEVLSLDEKLDTVTDQMKKVTRVQFKMAKQMEESFAEIKSDIQEQKEGMETRAQVERYEKSQDQLVRQFIQFLDEMDHLTTALNDEQQAWHQLLEEWTRSILVNLKTIGIHELEVFGKVFDPTVAEAIGTVDLDPSEDVQAVPYQVMKVIKRGFIDEQHCLIRKAQVVTLKTV